MFFHWRVFFHSLIFVLILEAVIRKTVSGFLVSLIAGKLIVVIILLLVFLFIVASSSLKISRRFGALPIPLTLTFSALGLLAFIDSDSKKFFFIILSWATYYFCLLGLYRLRVFVKDQTARAILAAVAVASIFLFYSLLYGFYLNFSVSLWIVMFLFMVPTVAVSHQYLRLMEAEKGKVWLYSLVLGFCMTEIAWILNFWPFGYLTNGVVMLIFYFMLWNLAQSHFLNIVSKRGFVWNIVFFGILAIMVLASSKWLPVV